MACPAALWLEPAETVLSKAKVFTLITLTENVLLKVYPVGTEEDVNTAKSPAARPWLVSDTQTLTLFRVVPKALVRFTEVLTGVISYVLPLSYS